MNLSEQVVILEYSKVKINREHISSTPCVIQSLIRCGSDLSVTLWLGTTHHSTQWYWVNIVLCGPYAHFFYSKPAMSSHPCDTKNVAFQDRWLLTWLKRGSFVYTISFWVATHKRLAGQRVATHSRLYCIDRSRSQNKTLTQCQN